MHSFHVNELRSQWHDSMYPKIGFPEEFSYTIKNSHQTYHNYDSENTIMYVSTFLVVYETVWWLELLEHESQCMDV